MDNKIKDALHTVADERLFPKVVHIDSILKKKQKVITKRVFVIFALLIGVLFSLPDVRENTIASLRGEDAKELVNKNHNYVVWNDHFYVYTDKTVEREDIGEYLASVERTGTWIYPQNGDSNVFEKGAELYRIKGKKDAVGLYSFNRYVELKKQAPIDINKQLREDSMFIGEGEPKVVAEALKNIQQTFPHLKQLNHPDYTLTSIFLQNDGNTYYVKMKYEHTLFKDRTIWMRQYEKEFGNKNKEVQSWLTWDIDFFIVANDDMYNITVDDRKWTKYSTTSVFRNKDDNLVTDVSGNGYIGRELEAWILPNIVEK
ncbi:MAG: hypothetical protein ACI35O_13320 [Bacillaceae bacterium]